MTPDSALYNPNAFQAKLWEAIIQIQPPVLSKEFGGQLERDIKTIRDLPTGHAIWRRMIQHHNDTRQRT